MVEFMDLWLPIVASAALVFVASCVIHMVIPIHKNDMQKLPGEERILAAMRAENVAPGQYMFPSCVSMKDMCKPEHVEKMNKGPVGTMIVVPSGPYTMGKSLVQWFVLCVVLSVFAAYVGSLALPAGAEYGTVFRLIGTVGILGYAFSSVCDSIWKGLSWGVTARFFFDGLVYGLVTAGTFGWLWPAAGVVAP